MKTFFLLIAFLLSFSQGRITTPLNLSNTTQIHLDENSPVYFELVSPQAWDAPYLSISAFSQTDCFPSLLVVKYPGLERHSAYPVASDSRKALVFISTAELDFNTKTYVGVSSKTECKIDLMTEETLDYLLEGELDQYYRVYELQQTVLQNKSSAVLTVDIPPSNNTDRILIHINTLGTNKKRFSDLDMFIRKGSQVPDSRYYNRYESNAGFEGISVLIRKGNSLFCVNCSYTISLKFEEQTMLQVHVGILHPITELKSFPIVDVIDKGKRNTYVVRYDSNIRGDVLRIDVNPITNNLTIYVDCGVLPSDLNNARWSFGLDSFKEISLGLQERKSCTNNTYYIVVTGEEEAVYSIFAQQKVSNNLLMLKDNEKKGNILPGELIMYEAYLPLFAEDKLLINLKAKEGIDLSVKSCRFAFDCPDLLPSSSGIVKILDQVSEIELPLKFNYTVVQLGDTRQVKINPHENGCVPFPIRSGFYKNTPFPVCAYQITLVSKENITIEYELSAEIERHSLLFAGVPLEDSVSANDEKYYVLYAPYPSIKSVSFHIATLSGDVGLFVSNKTRYPKQEDDLSNFSHNSFIVFTNSPSLNEAYYITVKGYETSSFALNASVITQGDREEDYTIRIQEEAPQKGMVLALDSQNEQPFIFYSSSEGAVIRINIEYSIPKEQALSNDDDLEFSAFYSSEKKGSGSREPISVDKSYTLRDKVLDGVKYMRKYIEIKSNIGEYQFTVKNMNEQRLPFSFLVYTDKREGIIDLDQSSYHFSHINKGESEIFKLYLPQKGACYFELSQCSGKFNFSMADSLEGLDFQNNIPMPEDYTFFNKYYIEDPSIKYVRATAKKTDTDEETATFLVKNNCFVENWMISFKIAETGEIMVNEGDYKPRDRLLPISFEPMSFPEASGEDYAVYKIVACQDEDLARSVALCGRIPQDKDEKEKCYVSEINLSLEETDPVDTELSLEEATYYLYIVGNIIHKREPVHSVAYDPIMIALKERYNIVVVTRRNLKGIIIGLVVVVLLVLIYFVYKKLTKKVHPQKHTELANIKKQEYEVMPEEALDSNTQGSVVLE